jgi:UDP-N-acetylglucosamine--N-acetylmuramyl-(pentapeptide) pyrophosphoryl-undecaprenol N-acetylglucosamine transferase
MASQQKILFAGGGSGGHIFPNLAIYEQLRRRNHACKAHFLVADRDFDHQLMATLKLDYTPLLMKPWTDDLCRLWEFVRSLRSSIKDVKLVLEKGDVEALVSTGGYISYPATLACAKAKVPVVLVNLDAVPGKASYKCAKYASTIFSAYEAAMERAHHSGYPLRKSSIGPRDRSMARKQLKLPPDRSLLLVVGGSQGASSVNVAVAKAVRQPELLRLLQAKWQILHITGGKDSDKLKKHYKDLGIPATVVDFYLNMGMTWASSDLAVSRAGAGSVAEAWANATPTIFLPYPHHKDEHQRLNAQPVVDRGGAVLCKDDPEDPQQTVGQLARHLLELVSDPDRLTQMSRAMLSNPPKDGAGEIAEWLVEMLQH